MRRPPSVVTVDFETFGIQARPDYPPKPVGVSIKYMGKKAVYYGWGHPTENTCDYETALRALREVWESDCLVLFHHGKFDVDVAQTHMGMRPIHWSRIHDTMFLLFLFDPHAPDFKLKPASERLLNVAPDEQDAVRDWIMAHKRDIPMEFTPSQWGAAIAFAPGKLVGKYANGDTDRTEALFKYLWPRVVDRGMEEAYDRERQLMPILLENERVGVRVALPALRRDIKLYTGASETAEDWLRKRLKAPDLNLDSDAEVAEALSRAKIIDDSSWSLTATGKRSVSKKTLVPSMYKDPQVARVFGYRNRPMTCMKMFMIPWERQATARPDGHISTNWNQVRQSGGGNNTSGTRTGRPSCNNPNFLNLSKTWDDKDDGYEHPRLSGLDALPLVRKYILPDIGDIFCHRDYNGQELRILGHFEDGELLGAYQENPRLDVHDHVRSLIDDICGLSYHRTQVKITNFRRIYGGGAPATAGALGVSIDQAKTLLAAHGKALPGVKMLDKQIKELSRSGEPITTWGGRQYYVEPPKFDKKYGRNMTYEYKLLNYLIQGSAADVTKQAIINYDSHSDKRGRFLVTVYDEINVSAPKPAHKQEMAVLKEAMEDIPMDVAMLSDGKTGPNWGALTKYKD